MKDAVILLVVFALALLVGYMFTVVKPEIAARRERCIAAGGVLVTRDEICVRRDVVLQ